MDKAWIKWQAMTWRRWLWRNRRWLGLVFGMILAGTALYFARVWNNRARKACEQRGNRIEEFERVIYMTQSCGSGCFYTYPVPVTDWRCVAK